MGWIIGVASDQALQFIDWPNIHKHYYYVETSIKVEEGRFDTFTRDGELQLRLCAECAKETGWKILYATPGFFGHRRYMTDMEPALVKKLMEKAAEKGASK